MDLADGSLSEFRDGRLEPRTNSDVDILTNGTMTPRIVELFVLDIE